MKKLLILSTLICTSAFASPLEFSCSSNDVISDEMRLGVVTRILVDLRINKVATVQSKVVGPDTAWETAYTLTALDESRYSYNSDDLEITFIRGNQNGLLVKTYINESDKETEQEANVCTQY